MRIIWTPHVRAVPPDADLLSIELLERHWGVSLPGDYKRIVSKHQGMTPHPSSFIIGKGKNVFSVLLAVTHDERWDAYSVMSEYKNLQGYVPAGIYPFGMTPGGESLCFDYRAGGTHPSVVLVTVEGDIHRVAGSFEDFLAHLHE
jgi:hypothetical protein